MAKASEPEIRRLYERIDSALQRLEAQFTASLALQTATLRLLIDKGIITSQEAVREIEKVQRDFPGDALGHAAVHCGSGNEKDRPPGAAF